MRTRWHQVTGNRPLGDYEPFLHYSEGNTLHQFGFHSLLAVTHSVQAPRTRYQLVSEYFHHPKHRNLLEH